MVWRALSNLFSRQESPAAEAPRRRAVDIGWLLDADKATFIWAAPRRRRAAAPMTKHAKSVAYCPAVHDQDARTFEVTCPIDLRLAFRRDEKGAPALSNLDGDQSTIRGKHLSQMLAMVPEREWRHPARPIVQFITPYVFVADEPVWMTQLEPFGLYRPDPWPGALIGGRMPIHIWPRHLMWAFEWHDTEKPLVLKRGEPWFALLFEVDDPSRALRVVEAERTPELAEHMAGLSAVSNYVDQTFSLFKTAQERRPPQLLVRKTRGGTPAGDD